MCLLRCIWGLYWSYSCWSWSWILLHWSMNFLSMYSLKNVQCFMLFIVVYLMSNLILIQCNFVVQTSDWRIFPHITSCTDVINSFNLLLIASSLFSFSASFLFCFRVYLFSSHQAVALSLTVVWSWKSCLRLLFVFSLFKYCVNSLWLHLLFLMMSSSAVTLVVKWDLVSQFLSTSLSESFEYWFLWSHFVCWELWASCWMLFLNFLLSFVSIIWICLCCSCVSYTCYHSMQFN